MYSTLHELNDNSLNNYLNYGANLCKTHSKYKNLKDLKICYTTLKKLSKTNKIGEVLIKGKKNIIKIQKLCYRLILQHKHIIIFHCRCY